MSRGVTLEDAREYNIIGCVEPQKAGKTWGWHDAAFFNMCRPLELVFSNGMDEGEQVGLRTGDIGEFDTFEKFFDAYKKQMKYMISLLVNADNAIDMAHAERCPLPYLSSMVEDCIGRGKTPEQGGAIYNFTGPQGFGIANIADSLHAIKTLVYDQKKFSLSELKEALAHNFGKDASAETVKAVTEQVASALAAKGQTVTEAEVKQIYESVSRTLNTADSARYNEIRESILAIDKIRQRRSRSG